MTIHVHTQYKENYGDASAPYWKYKGGSTFVITGVSLPLTHEIGAAAQAVVDATKGKIEYANEYSEEYILDWEIVLDDAKLTEDEELQQNYDGRIDYPSKRIALAEVQ